MLPATGTIVTRYDAPIAYCSLWLTNGKLAFVAFPSSAPGLPGPLAYDAITLAIRGAVELAKDKGAQVIWTSTATRAIDSILRKQLGFTRTTPHHNHFLLLDPALSHDTLVGKDFIKPKG